MHWILLAVLKKATKDFKLGFSKETFQGGQDKILVLPVFIRILCFSLQTSYEWFENRWVKSEPSD